MSIRAIQRLEEELEEREKYYQEINSAQSDPASIGVVYEVENFLKVPSRQDILQDTGKSVVVDKKNAGASVSKTRTGLRRAVCAAGSCKKAGREKILLAKDIVNNKRLKLLGRVNGVLKAIDRSKVSIAPILLILIVAFTYIRAAEAKSNLESLANNVQQRLNRSFELIDEGDFAGALNEIDLAKTDIGKLKLIIQSWGQDVDYLRYVPGNHSKLVAEERTLDSIYLVLSTINTMSEEITRARNNGTLDLNSSPDGIITVDFTSLSKVLSQITKTCLENLNNSKAELTKAQVNLPQNLRSENDKVIKIVEQAIRAMNKAGELERVVSGWINDAGTKDVLILFQNNTEIRGSGGFIGSFAVAHLVNGKLDKIDFQTNIYKLDKAFIAKEQIAPPEEMLPLSGPVWTLRDSNWAVSGPEAFAKVKEFYELETGGKVDGVVALDTNLFVDLLKVTGPIEVGEFGKTIGSDNFLSDVQYEVEKGYFQREGGSEENEPKKILAVMMPRFINKISESFGDKEKLAKVVQVLSKSLSQKHLLFYSTDPALQKSVEEYGYGGNINYMISDYVFIHSTNLGGMKSSLNIQETVRQAVVIKRDGTVDSNLEIKREHRGSGQWPDGTNNNLLRILLPQNSKITNFSAKEGNFLPLGNPKFATKDIYHLKEEAGKAEVVYWQNTEPGKTSLSSLSYQSNYRVDTTGDSFAYHLYYQKQPGTIGDDIELEINYPAGFVPINVKNYDAINRRILIKHHLNEDKEFLIQFKRSGRD